jgi:hypothetical protein
MSEGWLQDSKINGLPRSGRAVAVAFHSNVLTHVLRRSVIIRLAFTQKEKH